MLALQGAAITASLLHVLVDVYLGLFGGGSAIGASSAAALVLYALVYGWWGVLLGLASRADALRALAVVAGIWGAVANGATVVGCLPPCPVLAPLGDVAHLASLVFGGWAGAAAWRARRRAIGPDGWGPAFVTVALLTLALAVIGINASPG